MACNSIFQLLVCPKRRCLRRRIENIEKTKGNQRKIYSSFINVTDANLTDEDYSLKNLTTIINSSNTIIPKLGLQLKYNFKTNNKINFKLGYYWEKTSSIKISQLYENETFVIKPKNSSLLTIGFSYFLQFYKINM